MYVYCVCIVCVVCMCVRKYFVYCMFATFIPLILKVDNNNVFDSILAKFGGIKNMLTRYIQNATFHIESLYWLRHKKNGLRNEQYQPDIA